MTMADKLSEMKAATKRTTDSLESMPIYKTTADAFALSIGTKQNVHQQSINSSTYFHKISSSCDRRLFNRKRHVTMTYEKKRRGADKSEYRL